MALSHTLFGAPTRTTRRRPPGPGGYPFIGILSHLRQDPLAFFRRTAQEYGEVARLALGRETVLMLNSPRLIRHVLVDNQDNYAKGKYFDYVKLLFGNGIFTANGDVWLRHRRTAQPAFNGQRLAAMAAPIVEAVDDMLARWDARGSAASKVDIATEMTEVTLDVVLRTVFSTRFGQRYRVLHHAMHAVLRDIERRIWSPVNLPMSWPTPRMRKLRQHMQQIHDCVDELITRRLSDPEAADDLLSMIMMRADPSLPAPETNADIRTQVLGMVIAGHETTANALTWTWYLLGQHPEVQARLHDEVTRVLEGRAPCLDDLKNLPFTLAVFAEAMRLYPPIWTISRAAISEDEIHGYPVRTGQIVMLCAYAVHRNPSYWPDPDRFEPERFYADGGRSAARGFSYFPFGGGPRTCLGSRFAMMEGALIIARMAQSRLLTLAEGQNIVPEPMISLRPSGAVIMNAAVKNGGCRRGENGLRN